jgi:hypothetical protein
MVTLLTISSTSVVVHGEENRSQLHRKAEERCDKKKVRISSYNLSVLLKYVDRFS